MGQRATKIPIGAEVVSLHQNLSPFFQPFFNPFLYFRFHLFSLKSAFLPFYNYEAFSFFLYSTSFSAYLLYFYIPPHTS